MPYIEMIIKSHNKKLLNKEKITDETFNCRDKNKYPLKAGNCRTENVMYEASVSTKKRNQNGYWTNSKPIKEKNFHTQYNNQLQT